MQHTVFMVVLCSAAVAAIAARASGLRGCQDGKPLPENKFVILVAKTAAVKQGPESYGFFRNGA
jgi:hypothetical protein